MAIRKFLNKYWGWTFLLIPLALQAIFFYFPMVQGAFYSLTNWTGLTYNYKFVGLNNYKLLMIDGKFFTEVTTPKSRMSTNSITGAYSIFPLC